MADPKPGRTRHPLRGDPRNPSDHDGTLTDCPYPACQQAATNLVPVSTPDTPDVEQLRRDLEQAIYDRDRAREDCQRTRDALLPLLPELAVQNAKTTLRAGYVAEEAATEIARLGERPPAVATVKQAVERAARAIEREIVTDVGSYRLPVLVNPTKLARAALRAAHLEPISEEQGEAS